MIYLDSAAVVKLVHAEPESPALRHWLDERPEAGWISSVLTENRIVPGAGPVRARGGFPPARRAGPDRPDRSRPAHRILARTTQPVTTRSRDAIHLSAALYSRRRPNLVRDL